MKKKSYLFYKITDKQFPKMGSWWVLVIDTVERLYNYNEFKSKQMTSSYFKAKSKINKKQHLTWEEFVLTKILEFRPNRKTMIDDITILSRNMISPMTNFFLSGKIPLINQVGGYRFLNNTVKILHRVKKDNIIWPEDSYLDIKISRWPEGKHYYAKVGKYDVQDEKGNVKWNTAKEAKRVAKTFLKNIKNELT